MPAPIGSIEAFTIDGFEAAPPLGETVAKIVGVGALVLVSGLVLMAVLRRPEHEPLPKRAASNWTR